MPEPGRLDTVLNQRRVELGLTWRDLSKSARISYEALRAFRRGEYRPTELTARRLDEALHWEPGSVEALLDGGSPTPVQESRPPGDEADPHAAAIAAILQTLPPEAQADVLRQVQEQIRQPGGESGPKRNSA